MQRARAVFALLLAISLSSVTLADADATRSQQAHPHSSTSRSVCFQNFRRRVVAFSTDAVNHRDDDGEASDTSDAPQASGQARAEPSSRMEWRGWLFLTVVLLVVIGLWRNIAPMFSIMAISTVFFYITTLLESRDVFAGFANNGIISVALLCVIVHPISELPVLKALVRAMMHSGSSPRESRGEFSGVSATSASIAASVAVRLSIFKVCLLCFLISPFIENTPHIAVFTPLITQFCHDSHVSTSQLLMPMCFAVILGNYMTISASANLVLSGMMEEAKLGAMPLLELAKVNLPLLVPSMLYLVLAPAILLPTRRGGQSFYCKLKASHESPLLGRCVADLVPSFRASCQEDFEKVVIVRRGDCIDGPLALSETIFPGDELIISGLITTLGPPLQCSPSVARELLPHECTLLTDDSRNASPLRDLNPEGPAGDRENGCTIHDHQEPTSPGSGDEAANQNAVLLEELTGVPAGMHDVVRAVLGQESGSPTPSFSRTASFSNRRVAEVHAQQFGSSPGSPIADYLPISARAPPGPSGMEAVAAATTAVEESSPMERPAMKNSSLEESILCESFSLELFVIVMAALSPLISHTEKVRQFAVKYGVMVLTLKTSPLGVDFLSGEDAAVAAPNLAADDSVKVPEHVQQEWKQTETLLLSAGGGSSTHGGVRGKLAFRAPLTMLTPGCIVDPASDTKTFFIVAPSWFPFGARIGGQENPRRVVTLPTWYENVSLVIFVAIILAAVFGVPLAHAALVGLCAMTLLGLSTTAGVLQHLPVESFILTSMSVPLGIAMRESGFAGFLGHLMVRMQITGLALLLFIGLISMLLSNLITNQGAVQVLFPLVVKVYQVQAKNPLPGIIMLASTVGCAFCTPFGAPANAMIVAPGRYVARDFIRFGLPISAILVVLTAVMCAAVYDSW